ncbi:hypothetical protein ACWD5F_09780 [Streptomyces sp. NPDC002499]
MAASELDETENREPGDVMLAWDFRLDRSGMRVRAGRHLQLSMSLAMIWWLLTVAGVVSSSPFWGQVIL